MSKTPTTVDDGIRADVVRALQESESAVEAAKLLGVSRATLYRLIRRYGITIERRVK